jgi:hypothetical protein
MPERESFEPLPSGSAAAPQVTTAGAALVATSSVDAAERDLPRKT